MVVRLEAAAEIWVRSGGREAAPPRKGRSASAKSPSPGTEVSAARITGSAIAAAVTFHSRRQVSRGSGSFLAAEVWSAPAISAKNWATSSLPKTASQEEATELPPSVAAES